MLDSFFHNFGPMFELLLLVPNPQTTTICTKKVLVHHLDKVSNAMLM
jgi:hypothetical protein